MNSNQLGYFRVKKIDITIRHLKDKTIEGLNVLEEKKKSKKPGSITFHLDDNGVVVKVISENVIK